MQIKASRMQGFSLIELLVAVVIMAVGILGVAGLQVVSMQQNRSAMYRGEATQLANDILDRMRVNQSILYTSLLTDAPTATKDCEVNTCTPAEMAAYDIAQWKCAINSKNSSGADIAACTAYKGGDGDTAGIVGQLPDGAGSIAVNGQTYTVTVQWVDDHSGTTASVVVEAQVN